MKPSKFNIVIPLPGNKKFLIFNTFTDSRVVVNKKIREALEKSPVNESLLDGKKEEILEELSDLGIVIEDDVDEDMEMEYWFQRLKFDTSVLDITVLTTYACNLRCTYCYEDGIKRTSSMEDETCKRTILWIIKRLDKVKPNTLRLTFFGGEPLLHIPPMQLISEEIYYACQRRKIELDIRLVTNGILLTREVIDSLKDFGLRGIKVTLDGDPEAHDAKRRYQDGRGTFDTILENIKQIMGRVPITIGGNFDDSNKESIPRLLSKLKASGFTEKQIEMVRFKPILATMGRGCTESRACSFSSANLEDFLWIRKEIKKRGFTTSEDIAIGPCEVVREHNYVIDPVGKIYKCAGFVGREEFIIGDIKDDRPLLHTNTQFMTADLWRKCKGCPYIPICGGGCRVNSQTLWGNFLTPACETEYFLRVSQTLLKNEAIERR